MDRPRIECIQSELDRYKTAETLVEAAERKPASELDADAPRGDDPVGRLSGQRIRLSRSTGYGHFSSLKRSGLSSLICRCRQQKKRDRNILGKPPCRIYSYEL